MDHSFNIFSNSKLGMFLGFLGFVFKSIFLAEENAGQSLLTVTNIYESSVIAIICTIIGLIITALYEWFKNMMGYGKKKRDD